MGRMKERWRWSFTPAGAREQLVLFNHGERGGQEVQEVRAAILESEYGRGLYYASGVSRGREIGYYDGVEVTLQQYNNLDEYTGLRHTLEVGGKMVSMVYMGSRACSMLTPAGVEWRTTTRSSNKGRRRCA